MRWGVVPKRVIERKEIPVSMVKDFLDGLRSHAELAPIQHVTFDYASKLVRLPSDVAEKLVEELMENFNLSRLTAVQIVNILPRHIEELRPLLIIEGRVFLTSELEKILDLISKYIKEPSE